VPNFPWAKKWPEITNARVREAFRAVPRANFVPEDVRHWAGRDAPLPIGEEQTISQPFVVALMSQALDPKPGERVLEIGTGSGFQTAILCELTAESSRPKGSTIYSVERFPSLARTSGKNLAASGYTPHLRMGDGVAGWPEAAPFDAIVVTAAPAWLPRPLWTQLADGGRMVIPVGPQADNQQLWLLRKTGDEMTAQALGSVRFVPLVSPLLADRRNRLTIRPGFSRPVDEWQR
jgi:protein-L-isoaspartate(D-aspartate) O-methyltransferase